jgi:radical SAM superfamily enzyme YgiQ (UPF0313 family)
MAYRRMPRTTQSEPELGTIHKDHRGRTRIALIYPNTYAVGMSNLGFQTVYRLLNDFDEVVCERAFLPREGPFSTEDVRTVESHRPLNYFDIIAFSISFENDYPHVLNLLEKAKIPSLSSHRTSDHPLVMAGGVACFLNPEPLAPFMDLMVIGEAESVLPDFFRIYDPGLERDVVLKMLAQTVPGVYVPSFYRVEYDGRGILKTWEPTMDVPLKILRAYVPDLSRVSTTSTVISKSASFGSTFLIETGRGCPHGCRFCSAGYVYRPTRFRSLEQLSQSLDEGMALTDRIGLVGTAITDLPDLKQLCDRVKGSGIRVSFSSLRADRLSEEVISVLRKSRVKTVAIAPDAGSQRMRNVIKKGITEQDILSAVEKLVSGDIFNIKLYFMIGLPTELMEDIIAIVDLCKRVKQVFLLASRIKQRMGTITVSINPFVPKPFTPFQWAAMNDMNTIKAKMNTIKAGLKSVANVRIIMEKPLQAYTQALLSRGDRRAAEMLLILARSRGNWPKFLRESIIDPDFFALRERDYGELLPWYHIDQGFHLDLLERENEKAKKTT